MQETQRLYGDEPRLSLMGTPESTLNGADALIVCTEWQQFKARTLAPAAHKASINTRLGASRMSSVLGLNAKPHRAKVFPLRSPLKNALIRSNSLCFCRSLMASTACNKSLEQLTCWAL